MTIGDQVNGALPGPPGAGRLTRAGKPRRVPGAPCPDCGATVAKNGRCYGCAPGGKPSPVKGEWADAGPVPGEATRSGFPRAAAAARPGAAVGVPGREAVAPAAAVHADSWLEPGTGAGVALPAPVVTAAGGPAGKPDDLFDRELAAARSVRAALAGLPAESVSFVLSAVARHLPAPAEAEGVVQGGVR